MGIRLSFWIGFTKSQNDLLRRNQRAVFLPQVSRIMADQGTVLLFLGLIFAVELQRGDTHRLLALLAFYFVLSRRLLPLVSQISLIAGQMDSSYENVRIVDSELEECRRYRALPLLSELADPRAGPGAPASELLVQQTSDADSSGHQSQPSRG